MATRGVRVTLWAAGLTLALAALAFVAPHSQSAVSSRLPARISDQDFWHLIETVSEPNGYFRSDNFLSNESGFQRVIPDLQKRVAAGGVYLGVGPEQNFTYIAALRPRLAFIIDIRRQNLIEHLMYKAFIEQSTDRADFLSRLFARPRPSGVDGSAGADALFRAYGDATPSRTLFRTNLSAAREWLTKRHGFTLGDDDLQKLEYVYGAFFDGGPDLEYSFGGYTLGRGFMPTYAELMTATDADGEHRSYLATEENFRAIKRLESSNLIVPLVGNFAGDRAVRGAGRYLKDHGATVTVFYTSNVEQYLFQQGDEWRRFLANVATLPVDDRSIFIRSVSNRWSGVPTGGARATTMLCPMGELLKAFKSDRVQTYGDVIAMSRP